MGALGIVAGIIAMLCVGGIGALAVVSLATGKTALPNILIVSGAGTLFLAHIFGLIVSSATLIIGAILMILGWPALAVGFLFLYLPTLKQAPAAAEPQAQ